MREIKFRGKDVYDNQWYVGNVEYSDLSPKVYIKEFNGVRHKVIPETVGQFTGRYDKNGKEIYEGDKIFNNEYFGCKSSWSDCKDNFPKIRIIVFDINYSKFNMCYVEENIRDRGASGYTFCKSNESNFEVIGNIH